MASLPDYVQFKAFVGTPLRHIFTAAPDDQLQLLSRCLALNPLERCSCSDALQMPYFANKPAPAAGPTLPLPAGLRRNAGGAASAAAAAADKSGTKRKGAGDADGGTLAKRLIF